MKMRFDFSKLVTPIKINELKTVSNNGMPSKPKPVTFYECFAHIETVSLKDYETSVQTGTQYNIKVFVRNYPGITNKMQIVNLLDNQEYQINQVLFNYRQSGFTVIIASEVER